MKFTFNKTYAIYAIGIFLIEVCIALFLKDGFIRHTFGDYLVVILMYCAIKTVFPLKTVHAVVIVFGIAIAVECLQLTNFLEFLRLGDNTLAKLIFGSTFHVSDIVAYSLGCLTILIVEHFKTDS